MKSKKKLFLITLLSVLILVTGCSSAVKVDELFTIKELGANDHGSIELEPNYDYISKLGLSDMGNLKDLGNMKKWEAALAKSNFIDSITYEIRGDNKGLKNGDTVVIDFDFNKDLAKRAKMKINKKTLKYKMKSLIDAKPVSVFDSIEYIFEGIDGKGVIDYQEKTQVPFPYEIEFDKSRDLKNGDKVVATLYYDEESSLDSGYVASETSKEITVSGLRGVEEIKSSEIFDKLTLDYTGASPNITLMTSNNLDSKFKELFSFNIIDEKDSYSVGDEVRIAIKYDDYILEEEGYTLVGESEKIIKIDEKDVGKYISDIDELDKESRKKIIEQVEDLVDSNTKSDNSVGRLNGFSEMDKKEKKGIQAVRLLNMKRDMLEDNKSYKPINQLSIIYKTYYEQDSRSQDIYRSYVLNNIIMDKDGNVDFKLNEIEALKPMDDINQLIERDIKSNLDIYNVTEYEVKDFTDIK